MKSQMPMPKKMRFQEILKLGLIFLKLADNN